MPLVYVINRRYLERGVTRSADAVGAVGDPTGETLGAASGMPAPRRATGRYRFPIGSQGTLSMAASRSRSTSRIGGAPKSLLYSRVKCEASP